MMRSRSRGFTLLEVTIAFAILAVSLGTLYALFATTIQRSAHEARLNQALSLAQSMLARAGADRPLQEASLHEKWHIYECDLTQVPFASPAGQPDYTVPMLKVTATVSWMEPAGKRELSLATLRLNQRTAP